MRWVWPTIIASTVVPWRASAISRIGPSHGTPAVLPIGFRPTFVPWWMTTTWTLTPSAREPLGLGRDPRRLVEEGQAGGRAGGDELGRVLELGADDADLDAVDGEDDRWRDPVGRLAGRRLDDVRGEEREVGSLLVHEQPGDAVVELVVAVRRRVEAPRVLDVDRRLVLEEQRVRRRCPDVVATGQDQPGAGQARELLVEHRREERRAADALG